jgi:hypothetical protein
VSVVVPHALPLLRALHAAGALRDARDADVRASAILAASSTAVRACVATSCINVCLVECAE